MRGASDAAGRLDHAPGHTDRGRARCGDHLERRAEPAAVRELEFSNMLKLKMAGGASLAPALPDPTDPRVQIWRDPEGRVCAYGHTLGGQHWMHLPGLASFAFDGTKGEVRAIAHPPARRRLIRDAYYRSVLPMALQALNREVLHASAIRAPRGVVALCGVSGAGKSTIAFGLSRRGYRAWADDALAFETAGPSVRAVPLPFRIRLRPASASFFAQNGTGGRARGAEEGEHRPDRERVPLAALAVLRRESGVRHGVDVERLRPSRAFPAVLAHAYCFNLRDLERKRRMVLHYLALAARVPVFEIRFPVGLEWLPAILDRIEQLTKDRLSVLPVEAGATRSEPRNTHPSWAGV